MLLHHAKQEFEDVRYSFEEWAKVKAEPKFEFGQLPAVEWEGETFTQSAAILRALGSKYGYYTTDPVLMWKIDSTIDALSDTFASLAKAIFNPNAEEKEKAYAEAFTNTLPKFYGILEKRLKDNSS
jgi:glutathione S-transferase